MNDNNKRLWDNSIGNVDDDIVEEMADTLYKKSLSDIDSDELVIIESDKKKRIFPIFTIAASIVAIIGVAVITGVIISNSGFLSTSSGSENDSSTVSEIESDESSQTESLITTDTESNNEIPDDESDFLTYGDFLYTIETGDTITITGYTGNDNEIVIPKEINGKKVTSIGNDAFYSCEFLTSITIPDSVTSIGNGAFSGCAFLTSVTIPDSVISIDDYAFFYCKLLTAINVAADNQKYCSVDGVLFSKDMTNLIYYPTGKTDTSYTIPDGVTSINDYAFFYCTSLTSVTTPDSVTRIGNSAFFNCTALTSVTIPDSVTSIGDAAYYYCTSLTSVTIPDSVTSIGVAAFYNCTSLTSVTIPDSVTSIGDSAFTDCTALTSVNILGFNTEIAKNAFDSHVFITCAPLIKKTILYVLLAIVAVVIIVIIIRLIIKKDHKQRVKIAEYYRRKREAREKSEKSRPPA